WHPLHWFAPLCGIQIGSRDSHSRSQLVRIADNRDTAVLWHIEPLVCIRCPRVCLLGTDEEMFAVIRDTSPQSESAIHMHPCLRRTRFVRNVTDRIECAGIDVARLSADDGRPRDSW